MVADIQPPGATPLRRDLREETATDFVAVGNALVMALDDGIHGAELWVSDGTSRGTHLLRDVCPGSASSLPRGLTRWQDAVYFSADDGAHGRELWRTDGTAAGTRLVADLVPGLTGSDPWFLADGGAFLYFAASTPEAYYWRAFFRSDGTAEGTLALTPSSIGSYYNFGIPLGVSSGGLVFAFEDHSHGLEPWVTDGTVAGTHLLADLAPGGSGSLRGGDLLSTRGNASPVSVGGRALFQVYNGSLGLRLWASDGTPEGTKLVRDVRVGVGPIRSGDRVYFGGFEDATGYELWVSDGTTDGTARLSDIEPGPGSALIGRPTPFGQGVLFSGGNAETGAELWISDGTPAGTVPVKDVNPGPASGLDGAVFAGAFAFDRYAYFLADDGIHGVEPWVTDGTEAGTRLLADASPGGGDGGSSASSDFGGGDRPTALGGKMIFRLVPGLRTNELWMSYGKSHGTRRLALVDRGGSGIAYHLDVATHPGEALGVAGETVVFPADDGQTGVELWRSHGTAADTALLADLQPGSTTSGAPNSSTPSAFHSTGPRSLFFYTPPLGGWPPSLAGTDGADAWLIRNYIGPSTPVQIGAAAFYLDSWGWLLGTDAGPGPGTSTSAMCQDSYGLAAFGDDRLFFAGSIGIGVGQPFVWAPASDPVPVQLGDTWPNPEPFAEFLGAAGSLAYFSRETETLGRELWQTDGKPGGAVFLGDLAPGPASGIEGSWEPDYGRRTAALGDVLLLPASDGSHGRELWRSDGSVAGTAAVADLQVGPLGSEPRWLIRHGDRVLFVADDGLHGRELWSTDGTAEGTTLLRDLWPGPDSGEPQRLTAVDGLVVFAATDGVHGLELWRTDGTAAGTWLVQDLAPGLAAGGPMAFKAVGDTLYFVATDAVHGFELWRLPLAALHAGSLFADGFEAGGMGGWDRAATGGLRAAAGVD
jgi:ELWxxDGT repeat protein